MRVGINVAVFQDNRILLTKRNDFEVWCMPGGKVESGETVVEAALRETYEETGLEVKLTGLVGVYSMPKSKAWCNLIVSFTAYPRGGNLKLQESEVQEIRFFNVDDIPQELLWGQRQRIKDALNSNGGGVAWLQNIPFDSIADRVELYEIQNRSGLSKLDFYKTHFGFADPVEDRNEIE